MSSQTIDADLSLVVPWFKNPTKTANGFDVCCPAHNDNHQSLSISSKNGMILYHCHAGCTVYDIQRALGVKLSEMLRPGQNHSFQTKERKSLGRVVASYDYLDEEGNPSYRVERREGKKFRQLHHVGNGQYKSGLNGCQRLLYRLRELIAASENETIFIVEGEKDCDNLRALGFTVTTNSGGAEKWEDSFNKYFDKRNVVIIPDNDEPGRKHATRIASSLASFASTIRILNIDGLPPKGDISDWIDAGGTAERLITLVAECPQWDPSAAPAESAPLDFVKGISNHIDLGKGETIPIPIPGIIDQIFKLNNEWPRRADTALFIHDKDKAHFLDTTAALFGYLNSQNGCVMWQSNSKENLGYALQSEVFAELKRVAIRYDAIEAYPHYPTINGRYYLCGDIEPGSGDKLRELVNMFSPATDADSDLILAAILSLFWGGDPGSIPCFLVSSDDGRGAGKTTFAELIADIVGGSISVTANEDVKGFKTRLLSPSALTKRVVILDNLKSRKFSWGELEGLITGKDISGHQLYKGEFCRPNNIVWIITLNGPSLAEDMAQRSVMIKLAKQKYQPDWRKNVQRFIDNNRASIIADAIGILKQGGDTLADYSRWGAWEQQVLACVPEPGEAQRVIAERRNEANADTQEVEILEEYFAERLAELGYQPDTAIVGIPVQVAAKWYGAATNDRMIKTTSVSNILSEYVDQQKTTLILKDKSRTYGRRWIWCGGMADPISPVSNDIDSRIAHFEDRNKGCRA